MAFDRYQDPKYVRWAQLVKARDGQACVLCGKWTLGGKGMHAHHLNSWSLFEEQRYDVGNGATLCNQHHQLFHSLYSYGGNTRQQFEDFQKSFNLIKKAAKNGKK